MPPAKTYRYHLPTKAIKANCPQCGPRHRRTLSRYVDGHTGEPLPEPYGRCDRESNCGYSLSPYDKSAAGLSYADEVYQQWKTDNPLPARTNTRLTPPPPAPVYSLPDEVFRATVGHYDQNQFARLLITQFGPGKAAELPQRFQIGTSSYWPGSCVFWLIDQQHRARAGQVVLFAGDWHKARYTDKEGETKTCISSVSHGLLRRYRKAQQPAPDWLTAYHENAPRWPILFGLHQLSDAPVDTPVAIVEAPKTAVICSYYLPGFVWLAVGSLSYLNAERLAPLRGRSVMLYPDASKDGKAFARWSKIADELNQTGYQLHVSDLLEQRANDEQKQAGLDLADFLLCSDQTPAIVRTIEEQLARPGSTLKPDESEIIRFAEVATAEDLPAASNEPPPAKGVNFSTPAEDYPASWDEPNPPDAKPCISAVSFHQWQQQHRYFGRHGIASLKPQQ